MDLLIKRFAYVVVYMLFIWEVRHRQVVTANDSYEKPVEGLRISLQGHFIICLKKGWLAKDQ